MKTGMKSAHTVYSVMYCEFAFKLPCNTAKETTITVCSSQNS